MFSGETLIPVAVMSATWTGERVFKGTTLDEALQIMVRALTREEQWICSNDTGRHVLLIYFVT